MHLLEYHSKLDSSINVPLSSFVFHFFLLEMQTCHANMSVFMGKISVVLSVVYHIAIKIETIHNLHTILTTVKVSKLVLGDFHILFSMADTGHSLMSTLAH